MEHPLLENPGARMGVRAWADVDPAVFPGDGCHFIADGN
jgi:hypothetical protein